MQQVSKAWFILPGNLYAVQILTSKGCFHSEFFAGVDLYKSSGTNCSMRTCAVKVRIAFAGSMNRALMQENLKIKQDHVTLCILIVVE